MIDQRLDALLAACGLVRRGAFRPAPNDGVPAEGACLVLVGNDGPMMWHAFRAQRQAGPNPLDSWSRHHLSRIAGEVGARAFFPFGGPPHLPFQRWALKAEPLHPSPIRTLLHRRFGLWHAYRGALLFPGLFPGPLELPAEEDWPSPCVGCANQPCLQSCPVAAWRPGRLDLGACIAYLGGPAGGDCMACGCLARRACAVGREHVYAPEQAAFHMAAFLARFSGIAA